MKKLTVGKLKELLKDVPDNMEVVLGWQFASVKQAQVKTITINGAKKTGFELSRDEDDD